MHGQLQEKMSWQKWSEVPDIKLSKSAKETTGVDSNPHGGAPTLCSPLLTRPSLPASRPPPLPLFCSPHFDMLFLCPSLTQLNPVFFLSLLLMPGPPPSSAPRPVPHPLHFFFLLLLPSYTVTLESIQDGLCYAASLSLLTNTSIQRIKGRMCWLRHKPFPWLLITKWSWVLTTQADKRQKGTWQPHY